MHVTHLESSDENWHTRKKWLPSPNMLLHRNLKIKLTSQETGKKNKWHASDRGNKQTNRPWHYQKISLKEAAANTFYWLIHLRILCRGRRRRGCRGGRLSTCFFPDCSSISSTTNGVKICDVDLVWLQRYHQPTPTTHSFFFGQSCARCNNCGSHGVMLN